MTSATAHTQNTWVLCFTGRHEAKLTINDDDRGVGQNEEKVHFEGGPKELRFLGRSHPIQLRVTIAPREVMEPGQRGSGDKADIHGKGEEEGDQVRHAADC